MLWFREAVLPVNTTEPVTDIFVIQPGEPIRTIANNLEDEGYIRDSLAFFLLVKRLGIERNIQAGDFRLSTAMSAQDIIEELQHGTIDVWVTIPEGWRSEEIAIKLTQELAIPEKEFLQHAEEGYMFPDTYLFPKLASGSAVAEKMRSTFNQKVAKTYLDDIESSEFTLQEIVTLASLVEREARFDEERPIVASVLINRLREGMALDIDATLQYALGYQMMGAIQQIPMLSFPVIVPLLVGAHVEKRHGSLRLYLDRVVAHVRAIAYVRNVVSHVRVKGTAA